MNLFELIAVLVALAAAFAYLNARFIRLPTTIGVMVVGLVFSLGLLGLGFLGFSDITDWAQQLITSLEFDRFVLDAMLSVLLFAGALHVRLEILGRQWRLIGLLATIGVCVSVALIGLGVYGLQAGLGVGLPFIYCLLFGAVIAPTDPVAVLGIVQRLGLPPALQTKIAGESLFNDGFAVVVFLAIAGLASGHSEGVVGVAWLFAEEVVGGLVLGGLMGGLGMGLMRSLDDYLVEVLITLALVLGGYALAVELHLSGPLAVVVAGLLIGNQGRRHAMSQHTAEHVDQFWELADELLNILLFMLVALELLIIPFQTWPIVMGLVAIPLVLAARFLAVGGVIRALSPLRDFDKGTTRILTWGGLRGGISVALALSLPAGPEREVILTMTYVVVVFSVLVQGLTVAPLVRQLRSGA